MFEQKSCFSPKMFAQIFTHCCGNAPGTARCFGVHKLWNIDIIPNMFEQKSFFSSKMVEQKYLFALKMSKQKSCNFEQKLIKESNALHHKFFKQKSFFGS